MKSTVDKKNGKAKEILPTQTGDTLALGKETIKVQLSDTWIHYFRIEELEAILKFLAHDSEAKNFISPLPFHVITESERGLWALEEKAMNKLLEMAKLILEAAEEEVRIKWHWPVASYFHQLQGTIEAVEKEMAKYLKLNFEDEFRK